jgi:hypothetical protein
VKKKLEDLNLNSEVTKEKSKLGVIPLSAKKLICEKPKPIRMLISSRKKKTAGANAVPRLDLSDILAANWGFKIYLSQAH